MAYILLGHLAMKTVTHNMQHDERLYIQVYVYTQRINCIYSITACGDYNDNKK